MTHLLRQTCARTALLAALIGLAGAHTSALALPDQAFIVETCPMAALGRDPSTFMRRSSCGVWNPGDFTTVPGWNTLELMAIDGHASGAGVVATLQCMSRATGAVSNVAIVRSVPSSRPKKIAARLPAPLNFGACAYAIHLDVNTGGAGARALMVVLRR
jgi:hypothetical protein